MQVSLSKRAKNKLERLLEYLETEWSEKVKNDFITKLNRSIKQISFLPDICPESNEFPGLYKCVVTKQTSIYYRIKNNEIEIITLFDNRQNPNKLKTEAKKEK
ncbi:MAG: type II toxin-antitoxin system RelE/ParE family toxin [Bacteroidales bacterium]|nr:type II toxin-antitoxin system RelE/ParE family toxin [Bacteroidales bacterium]